MMLPWSAVIATLDRPQHLDRTLAGLLGQTHRPERIIVVDASAGESGRSVCQKNDPQGGVILWERAQQRSAARQRNQGAALVSTPLVAFADDDIIVPAETLSKLIQPFTDNSVGGVAGRIHDLSHPVPRGLTWLYYRIQAGYSHAHYGACVIGPGINLLPAFASESRELVPAQWLNSTLVVYRREVFEREQFPAFDGYSFLEDAHLSFRIGRTHRLYFHSTATYVHDSQPSAAKANRRELARMIITHQNRFSRDVLKLGPFELAWKLALHRVFQTVATLRRDDPGRWQMVRGFWDRIPE